MKDHAGLTRAQTEAMPVPEQYLMLSERFETMLQHLEPAQRAIYSGEWELEDIGEIVPGHAAHKGMAGTTWQNSYYLSTGRGWWPPHGAGNREDLKPFQAYVEAQGWSYSIDKFEALGTHQYTLTAEAGDGWTLWYQARSNGYYSLDVMSGAFWGDRVAIQAARHAREFDRGSLVALPGENPEFPAWDAPLKNSSDLELQHDP